ncbi:MAG: hypothetical protein Fur0010_27970 [Bdellovibrio sp.]
MKRMIIFLISFAGISCVGNNDAEVTGVKFTQIDPLASYSSSGNNFKLSLTDAPNKEMTEVVVNIDRILLKAGSSSKKVELVMARDVGQVDLLTLQNGKMMGISDLNLPVGTKVNQARLILKDSGNYIHYKDGSVCQLKTPSQQNTGLKIISPEFNIEQGRVYSMVIDFDAKKSIIHPGNGDCLLKPVLKWGGITSIHEDDLNDAQSGDDSTVEEEVIADKGSDGDTSSEDSAGADQSGTDLSTDLGSNSSDQIIDCQNLGFDPFDPTTYPSTFQWQDYEHCF